MAKKRKSQETLPIVPSESTLRMLDQSMKNYLKGKVSKPVNLNKMKHIADTLPEPHPEDRKKSGYSKVNLSDLPPA